MTQSARVTLSGTIVEEELSFTLGDLSRVCRVEASRLVALVEEGVLDPAGAAPDEWRFSGTSLRRARLALRLGRDLELGTAGTALVLDLLDEIDSLQSRLRRVGGS